MYEKNLTEDLRLRLSKSDMDFLRSVSSDRSVSISEVIRSILGEYRRSLETLGVLQNAINLAQNDKKGRLSYGDTKTDKHNKL